ncbi:hypothetical protein [Falsigemmobacter faecalis]|uniref:Uncharacterized protein n=1 Tax=Falsigemmobacter faecalis TaxID=2488730 RepID=A0A3P3DIA6_9RHOB|nr:hypothetical protein [Falsigemmobacter faecalis]RRH73446.1 hypothetical protein EG244_13140 [Falsigemmobacter faecalis]
MTRPTPLLRTASPRTVLSGLLVLLLMLVWQFGPGLRLSRTAGGAERVTTVLRTALPPEAVKSHQIAPAARSGDDGLPEDLPFAGLLPPSSRGADHRPLTIRAAAEAEARPASRPLRPAVRAPPVLHRA